VLILHTSSKTRTYNFHPFLSSSEGRGKHKGIAAFEKSIVEDAFADENKKISLLFTNDGPAFLDPNDFMLVAPTKNDFNTLKQDCSNFFVQELQPAS
jgi:hypothetical protein